MTLSFPVACIIHDVVHVHVYTCISIYLCTHIHVQANLEVCMCIYMYMYMLLHCLFVWAMVGWVTSVFTSGLYLFFLSVSLKLVCYVHVHVWAQPAELPW